MGELGYIIMPNPINLSYEQIKNMFDYNEETGILFWNNHPDGRFRPGTIAGTKIKNGLRINYRRQPYMAHRIIWVWKTGEDPINPVNHRNNIKTDNRWTNLWVISDSTRMCTICKEIFPLTENFFHKKRNMKNGFASQCKSCTSEYSKKQYEKTGKKWYKKIGKTTQRENRIKRQYGIAINEFNKILKKQNNKCASCGKLFLSEYDTYIDHDHKTEKVRGLLCNNCNTGIGFLGDDIKGVKAALNYLEAYYGKN